MNFCIISPITGLERYSTLSRFHLVLAHLLRDKHYYNFYAGRRDAGDFLILDNGAYENTQSVHPETYFGLARQLQPNVVVLPDVFMSPWRITTSESLKFLDTYIERFITLPEFMFVPQCQTTKDNKDGYTSREEFFQSLETAVNDGRVGRYIQWVGLGRYLHTEFTNLPGKGFRRANLAREIQRAGFRHLKVHALGMANGSVEELQALQDAGVHSIDSSAPVWRGWNGYSISDLRWKEEGTSCNFLTTDIPNEWQILQNLEACNVDTGKG